MASVWFVCSRHTDAFYLWFCNRREKDLSVWAYVNARSGKSLIYFVLSTEWMSVNIALWQTTRKWVTKKLPTFKNWEVWVLFFMFTLAKSMYHYRLREFCVTFALWVLWNRESFDGLGNSLGVKFQISMLCHVVQLSWIVPSRSYFWGSGKSTQSKLRGNAHMRQLISPRRQGHSRLWSQSSFAHVVMCTQLCPHPHPCF